jgi:hypothetical protein
MDAALLVPGDMVLLAAGSSVPADCLVNHGARLPRAFASRFGAAAPPVPTACLHLAAALNPLPLSPNPQAVSRSTSPPSPASPSP